ncbi:MAG: DUF1294 domain-containing protein [bacterium]|nr:DUF1294 domain-containing protein [bacterium]
MKQDMVYIIIIGYLVLINIAGFAIMGIDKKRAIRHKWRIPEKTLFLVAIVGGSVGSILGMQKFRHKTKHISFIIGFPAILIIQIIAALWLFLN